MSKVICIVDDQHSLRQLLRFSLNAHGFQVLEAESGFDALDKLAIHDIDMMIIDWQMPEMDGLELVRRLRRSENHVNLPIVIVSCCDDLSARIEARSLGVISWLKKPFRMSEIQLAVECALGLSSLSAKQHVGQSITGHV